MYSRTSGGYNDDKRNIIYNYCKKEGYSKKGCFKWNASEHQCRVCSNKGHFEDNCGLLKELVEEHKKKKDKQKDEDSPKTTLARTFFTTTVDDNSKDDIKFIIDSGVSQYILLLEHLFDNLNTSSK